MVGFPYVLYFDYKIRLRNYITRSNSIPLCFFSLSVIMVCIINDRFFRL